MAVVINGTTGISGVDGTNATPAVRGTDTNTGFVFGTDIIQVIEGGNESARFDASGNLLVGVTTANANGGVLQLKSGITFPATQVSASDVNTLDDYEEGTWIPTVTGVTGTGITYTSVYTKIGRIAYCSLTISGTGLAGSSVTSTQPFSGTAYGVGTWVSGGAVSNGVIQSVPYGNTAVYSGTFSSASVVNSNWIMTV